MTKTIYRSPKAGIRLLLTTDSPDSHHGIPVLRLVGVAGGWPDMGPADALPNGKTAADVVAVLVSAGEPPPGYGGTCPEGISSPRVRAAARAFLAQWPEGPQLPQGGPG